MAQNIIEKLVWNLERADASRPLLVYVRAGGEPVELNAKDILSGLNEAASRVDQAGFASGDIALVVPGHEPETVFVFLALISRGVIPCLLSDLRSNPTPANVALFKELAAHLDAKWLVSASNAVRPETFRDLTFPQYRDLRRTGSTGAGTATLLGKADQLQEIAYLQLTSGTTGTPKAIAVSHQALQAQLDVVTKLCRIKPTEVNVGWLPLNHDMGLITQVLMPLWMGSTSVLIKSSHWLSDPLVLLQAIDRYGGTVSCMPNFGLYYIGKRVKVDEVAPLDLSNWRLVFNGAEMIRPNAIANFNELIRHGGVKGQIVAPSYGLGENVLAVSIDMTADSPKTLWVSAAALDDDQKVVVASEHDPDAVPIVGCGAPIDGTTIGILHDNTVSTRNQIVGEIVIDGSSLCPRYVGDGSTPINTGSGFATGDLGFLHDGELFICGRKKEIAIVAGRNINPAIVSAHAERCLGDLQRRAAAFSIYSEQLGTEILVVVCETARKLSQSEQAEYASSVRRAILNSLDVTVSDIVFKANNWLPKTTSGKINIVETRKKYLKLTQSDKKNAGTGGSAHRAAGSSKEMKISEIAARIARVPAVDRHRDLFEQGMDSLGAAELLTEIEALYGTRVSEGFFDNPTIEYLLNEINNAPSSTTLSKGVSEAQSSEDWFLDPHAFEPRGGRSRINYMMRHGPKKLGRFVSYQQGTRLQKKLIQMPHVTSLFAAHRADLERWHEILAPSMSLDACWQESLFANTWMDWRISKLASSNEFAKWVTFSTPTGLFDTLDHSRGIVAIIPHVSRLQWPLYKIFSDIVSKEISVIRHEQVAEIENADNALAGLKSRATQAWTAANVLKHGGVLFIAGDGGKGNLPVEVPFAGRSMIFQGGAAELALRTNSYFLPVFPSLNDDGQIFFEFGDFLTSSAGDIKQQTIEITSTYGRIYEQRFHTNFQQFKWENLKNLFLRLV